MKWKKIIGSSEFKNIASFITVIFWICLFYQKINLPERISDRPTGEHVWAQIDRASMALTYYQDDAPFLLPRCHQANYNMEGITAGEFPLIPYTVSKLYSIFGFKEAYHRGFVLLVSIIGFLFSFLLALRLLKSYFWAVFSSVIWIASPNIIYYSASFLPDVPALAFVIISVYFLFRNKTTPSIGDWICFAFFFSLAGLIRASAILPISAITLSYLISFNGNKLKGMKKKLVFCFACIIPLIFAISWIYYSKWVVNHYGIFTFLMSPVPPTSFKEFREGMTVFLARNDYFYINGFYYFLGISTLLGLIFIKRSNKFLILTTILIYLSFFALFITLFKKGFEHSYYWIPFQIGIFFHVCWLADLARKIKIPTWSKAIVVIVAMIFINYNSIHVEKNVTRRWEYRRGLYSSYNDLEPYLDSLGIHYGSRVVSYNDPTFNNTLYLMNRKGWELDKGDGMDLFHKGLGSCQYAILNDTNILQNPELSVYFGDMMGVHGGLFIYSLKSR